MAKKETTSPPVNVKRTYETAYKKFKTSDKLQQISVEFYQWEEEGQVLVGKLIEWEVIESKDFEGKYNRYVFDTDDGLVGVICGTMFDTLIAEKDLKGKLLAVEYQGKRQLEGGRTVNRFKVSIIPEG